MAWKIVLKPSWPSAGFRRAGMDFSKASPVIIDELTPGLEKEKAKADEGKSALVFVEIDETAPVEDQTGYTFEELCGLTVAELRELAESESIQIPASAKKAEIVDTLFAAIGKA